MIRLPLLAGAAALVALPAFAFNATPPKPAFEPPPALTSNAQSSGSCLPVQRAAIQSTR
jgi:hypothetical protein